MVTVKYAKKNVDIQTVSRVSLANIIVYKLEEILRKSPAIACDEPADHDLLKRVPYAKAMARITETATPPLVVGLYGGWGVGKTTLMRLIDSELDKSTTRSIWFDPWLHQNDESPVLSFLHTMVSQLKLGDEARKILTTVAGALGSILLKASTSINIDDIMKIGKQYEKERFQNRDTQIRLREHFTALIKKARGAKNKRLVFFIDDLDRCSAKNTLLMLESLKLYFNLDGCIYFLGVDREALIESIEKNYNLGNTKSTKYLDKIVQLPFVIPPIHHDSMQNYVDAILDKDLKPCEGLLISCLGDNPRDIKRFINVLTFNHMLAKAELPEYDVLTLAALLLVQYSQPDIFSLIVAGLSSEKINDAITVKRRSNMYNHNLDSAIKILNEKIDAVYDLLYLTYTARNESVINTDPLTPPDKTHRLANLPFTRLMKISDELSEIVGNKPLQRTEITKRLWEYIKTHNLQDDKNKRLINADEKLLKIFNGKKQVSLFELTKLVSKHLS